MKQGDVGSMITDQQLRTVEAACFEATARGAKALTAAERVPEVPGPFFPPTVLTNVNHDMDVMREEDVWSGASDYDF
jgi:acyl-CoA reductase-like NAD-dependent aldehyde dehydrogenase